MCVDPKPTSSWAKKSITQRRFGSPAGTGVVDGGSGAGVAETSSMSAAAAEESDGQSSVALGLVVSFAGLSI